MQAVEPHFAAARQNQRWVADITEFPTGEGKLRVADVRDLGSSSTPRRRGFVRPKVFVIEGKDLASPS